MENDPNNNDAQPEIKKAKITSNLVKIKCYFVKRVTVGIGHSKKEAKQTAANRMLRLIFKNQNLPGGAYHQAVRKSKDLSQHFISPALGGYMGPGSHHYNATGMEAKLFNNGIGKFFIGRLQDNDPRLLNSHRWSSFSIQFHFLDFHQYLTVYYV